MKIEYCTHTYTNPCQDQEWCCDRFREFNKEGLIMIYDNKFCLYSYGNYQERLLKPIEFCPFCGEKIE